MSTRRGKRRLESLLTRPPLFSFLSFLSFVLSSVSLSFFLSFVTFLLSFLSAKVSLAVNVVGAKGPFTLAAGAAKSGAISVALAALRRFRCATRAICLDQFLSPPSFLTRKEEARVPDVISSHSTRGLCDAAERASMGAW